MTGVPDTRLGRLEERVTLIKPGEGDVTLLSAAGEIRFVEGRAHGVPLSVAQDLAGRKPGWLIEPEVMLKRSDERSTKHG